jgi:TonB family protein
MKRLAAVLLAAVLAQAAFADPAGERKATRPGDNRPASAPASVGTPHECSGFYPKEAIADNAEGTTELGFIITAAGTVRNINVLRSGGNAHLDLASVTCASRWAYRPAQREGVAVDVPWRVNVTWIMSPHFAEPPRDCTRAATVTTAMLNGIDGVTELDITITGEQIADVTVTHSSGNQSLDLAAARCVSTWRFQPVIRDGVPATKIRSAVIIWRRALAH